MILISSAFSSAKRAVTVPLSRERADEQPYRSRGEGFVALATRGSIANYFFTPLSGYCLNYYPSGR